MLALDELPLVLQQKWLMEIGYTEADELTKLGRDDHSYLYRFVFREVPVKTKILNESMAAVGQDDSIRSRSRITLKTAHLADENLSVIPVALYKNALTLESLDLSRNTLLDLPEDFFEMLRILRILVLKEMCLYALPPAIFQLQRLTHLNLSQNHLTSAAIRHLSRLPRLTNLDLSCNQLGDLPDSLAALKDLCFLNLSTNRLAAFPSVLFEFKNLKDLCLSFNAITVVPDEIDSIPALKTLILTGNSITHISPNLGNLKYLRLLDIRGNLVQDCSGVAQLTGLNELRADYNNISNLSVQSWKFMAMLQLGHNGLTSVTFSQALLHCKVVNLASCKLAGLPADFFSFLPNVHTIILDDNQLTRLPESTSSASWLEVLSAANNCLNCLDLQFGRLNNLKRLDLHGNNLRSLPEDIWQSPSLQVLNLTSNFLNAGLPDAPLSFDALPLSQSLLELHMADNGMDSDALMALSPLHSLTILNLSLNKIVDCEEHLNRMSRLIELYLSDNDLTALPDDFDRFFSSLKILHLNGNRFMTLSADLCRLSALEVLDVSGNNLKYNISNWSFDWNWAWNVELKWLNLSDNPKLEIRADRQPAQVASAVPNHGKSLYDFRNLVKLRFLNVAHVNIAEASIPPQTTSLCVRREWHADTVPCVGLAQFFGRLGGSASSACDTFEVVAKRFLNQDNNHVFGIFGGRGESLVSLHLFDTFLYDLETEFGRARSDEDEDEDLGSVLRRAFLNCNRRLSSQPTQIRSGSTGTVVYLQEDTLWIANVGDTMAVLSREGKADVLSTRHHPWSRAEVARIRELGGFVSSSGLVAGELDITRAFGYFHLLPFVNANPSIRSLRLTERDEFIIVATSELWRFVSYQMAVDLVRQFQRDLTIGAYKLRDLAIAYGAARNISVMVFDLRGQCSLTPTSAVSGSGSGNGGGGGGGSSRRESLGPLLSASSPAMKKTPKHQETRRMMEEIDPPTGEVTIVFTDIRDSTTLWEMYPAPMRAALRMHDSIMRRSLRRIGGYEVKNDGDSFMASFASVQTALKWCCSVQQELLEADWPQEIVDSPIAPTIYDPKNPDRPLFRGLSVRMGLHVGQPFCEIHSVTERMDYTGPMVNFAARVGSAPAGGQVFVTPQVIQQYAQLPLSGKDDIGPVVIFDMGMMRFKGVEKPERLFAIYPAALASRHAIIQQCEGEPFSLEDLTR